MPVRTSTEGKVFDPDLNLGQSNNPGWSSGWEKFGGQRSSEEKLRAYQMRERAKQRGQVAVPTKTKKVKFRIPRKVKP